ncbi:MAG: GNAT family N-acetyltransferase [Gammaproteobacteria bacterium]
MGRVPSPQFAGLQADVGGSVGDVASNSEMDDTGDVFAVRAIIDSLGIALLAVDELAIADLPFIRWAGSPSHLRSVAKQLARVSAGEVEYLAVRAPSGRPIAKGGVDYAVEDGAGMIWQLATHERLRNLGIGTLLVGELERRIERRGCRFAMLSVDQANPRSQRLYERLGYRVAGERRSGWESTRADGSTGWYEAKLTDLRKESPAS